MGDGNGSSSSNGKGIQKSERAEIQVDDRTMGRVVESLVLRGDISALNSDEKAAYYIQVCKSLGLNPASKPFAILKLNGKEIMYPERGATDQLAAMHRLNREIIEGPKVIDLAGTKLVYVVCRATHPNGRIETAIATVPLNDPLNAMMKCETKAKRRATLSILGLGMLDETEIETIPSYAKSPAPPVRITVEPEPSDAPRSSSLDAFHMAVDRMELPGEAVAIWITYRGAVAHLSSALRDEAWKALCKRTEDVGKLKNAHVWLRRAIAEEDARMAAQSEQDSPCGDVQNGQDDHLPQQVIDDVAQHESPLPLLGASAIWHDLAMDGNAWSVEQKDAAFQYLKRQAGVRSSELQRALAFEGWERDVKAARSVEELRAIYAEAKTAAKTAPWGKETAPGALAELEKLCAERKAKLTPPEPPNGGGAPKPEKAAANDADPEREAIQATASNGATAAIEAQAVQGTGAEIAFAARTILEWRDYSSTKRDKFELANSFLKHEADFKRLGIADECLAISADLLLPMLGTDSRNAAIGFIRSQVRKRAA